MVVPKQETLITVYTNYIKNIGYFQKVSKLKERG